MQTQVATVPEQKEYTNESTTETTHSLSESLHQDEVSGLAAAR